MAYQWWKRLTGQACVQRFGGCTHYREKFNGNWLYHRVDGPAFTGKRRDHYFLFGTDFGNHYVGWKEAAKYATAGEWGADEVRLYRASLDRSWGGVIRSRLVFKKYDTWRHMIDSMRNNTGMHFSYWVDRKNEVLDWLTAQDDEYYYAKLDKTGPSHQRIDRGKYLMHVLTPDKSTWHRTDGPAIVDLTGDTNDCFYLGGIKLSTKKDYDTFRYKLIYEGWSLERISECLEMRREEKARGLRAGRVDETFEVAKPTESQQLAIQATETDPQPGEMILEFTKEILGEKLGNIHTADGAKHYLTTLHGSSVYHNIKGPAYIDLENSANNRYYLYGFRFTNMYSWERAVLSIEKGQWSSGAVELYKRWLHRAPVRGKVLDHILTNETTGRGFHKLVEAAKGYINKNPTTSTERAGFDSFMSFIEKCDDRHAHRFRHVVDQRVHADGTTHYTYDSDGTTKLHRLDGPAIWSSDPSKCVWALYGHEFEKDSADYKKLVHGIVYGNWGSLTCRRFIANLKAVADELEKKALLDELKQELDKGNIEAKLEEAAVDDMLDDLLEEGEEEEEKDPVDDEINDLLKRVGFEEEKVETVEELVAYYDEQGRFHSTENFAHHDYDAYGTLQSHYCLYGNEFQYELWYTMSQAINQGIWEEKDVDFVREINLRLTGTIARHVVGLMINRQLTWRDKKDALRWIIKHERGVADDPFVDSVDRRLLARDSYRALENLLKEFEQIDTLAKEAEKEMTGNVGGTGGTGGMIVRGAAMGAKLAVARELNKVCVDLIEKGFEAAGFGQQYPIFLKTEAGRLMIEGGGPVAMYYFIETFPQMFLMLGIKEEHLEMFKDSLEIAFTAASMEGFVMAIGKARTFLTARMGKITELTTHLRDMDKAMKDKDYAKVLQISEHVVSAEREVEELIGEVAETVDAGRSL